MWVYYACSPLGRKVDVGLLHVLTLWIGKVNYTILSFAACHVVTRLSLCCYVLPVRHKLCKIGIANQNNSVNACRFRRKVVPLHRNSTEGMGD